MVPVQVLVLELGQGQVPVPGLELAPVLVPVLAWHKLPSVLPIMPKLDQKSLVSVSFVPP